MAYIALYRKWRPTTFEDLVGQEHVSKTLSQAILTGKIGHAYLFAGPRGTGKTSTAKILAKALNCEKGPTPAPCNVCQCCEKINAGSSMDVFEIDAASNRGIDEIRELRETVKFAPVDGRYKVYIIDEVHMLTTEAFNALLKTLEEPPAHVVFILATTEAHKVPATIQSRCQRYDFKRITSEEIICRLSYVAEQSQMQAEKDALELIAAEADGGMRDALSILDQCAVLSNGHITKEHVREILGLVGHEWIFRMADAIAHRDTQTILSLVSELLREGKDLRQLLMELTLHFRSLMIYQAAGSMGQMDLYGESEQELEKQAGLFPSERLPEMIRSLHEAINEMRWSPQPRITVEVTLLLLADSRGGVQQETGQGENIPRDEFRTANARLSQLEAKLAELAASMVSGNGLPSSKAVAEHGEHPAVLPEKIVSSGRHKVPESAPVPMTAAVSTETAAEGSREEAASLWAGVLQQLLQQNKKSVHACVSQGRATGMSEHTFFVSFQSEILAKMAMRNYKKNLEEILGGLAGRSLTLNCSHMAPPVQPAAVPRKREEKKTLPDKVLPGGEIPVHVDVSKLEPDARDRVQHAMEVFGDTFVKPQAPMESGKD